MKKNRRLWLLTLLLLSPQLQASEFSYNYIDFQYLSTDNDFYGLNINETGIALEGSIDATNNIAFTIGYSDSTIKSYDLLGFDINTSTLGIGADFHTPIASSTDIVMGISIVNAEISIPSLVSEDDTGNIINLSLRHKITPTAELLAGVSRTDLFDSSDNSFGAALLVAISKKLQLGVGYKSATDAKAVTIGLRAGF